MTTSRNNKKLRTSPVLQSVCLHSSVQTSGFTAMGKSTILQKITRFAHFLKDIFSYAQARMWQQPSMRPHQETLQQILLTALPAVSHRLKVKSWLPPTEMNFTMHCRLNSDTIRHINTSISLASYRIVMFTSIRFCTSRKES